MAEYDDALLAKAAEALLPYLSYFDDGFPAEAALAVLDAVAPLIAAQALEEVAREWQFGGWTILTAPVTIGAISPLALGQRVTDWLRARTEQIAAEPELTPEEQREALADLADSIGVDEDWGDET